MNKFAWVMMLLLSLALGLMEPWFALVFILMNAITFGLYYFDKRAAIKNQWRISERTLQISALLGGWPAALLAQHHLRHKSQKTPFKWVLWLCILLNILAIGLLCYQHWLVLAN